MRGLSIRSHQLFTEGPTALTRRRILSCYVSIVLLAMDHEINICWVFRLLFYPFWGVCAPGKLQYLDPQNWWLPVKMLSKLQCTTMNHREFQIMNINDYVNYDPYIICIVCDRSILGQVILSNAHRPSPSVMLTHLPISRHYYYHDAGYLYLLDSVPVDSRSSLSC